MIANDGQHLAQRLERLADRLAGEGMHFHHSPLIGCEIRSLFQNLIGNRDLAQVVQIAASTQRNDRFLIESEIKPQVAGIHCQSFAVAFGVRVAALHAQAESAEHGFRRFQFVGKFLEPEQRLDPGKQFFGKNRFVQKIVGTGFDSQYPVLTISKAGDEHEWDQPGRGIGFYFAAQFVS